jgi:hypothetical protein
VDGAALLPAGDTVATLMPLDAEPCDVMLCVDTVKPTALSVTVDDGDNGAVGVVGPPLPPLLLLMPVTPVAAAAAAAASAADCRGVPPLLPLVLAGPVGRVDDEPDRVIDERNAEKPAGTPVRPPPPPPPPPALRPDDGGGVCAPASPNPLMDSDGTVPLALLLPLPPNKLSNRDGVRSALLRGAGPAAAAAPPAAPCRMGDGAASAGDALTRGSGPPVECAAVDDADSRGLACGDDDAGPDGELLWLLATLTGVAAPLPPPPLPAAALALVPLMARPPRRDTAASDSGDSVSAARLEECTGRCGVDVTLQAQLRMGGGGEVRRAKCERE